MMLGDPERGIEGLTRELADSHGYSATDFRWVSFSSSHQSDLAAKVSEAVTPMFDEMDESEVKEWDTSRHVRTLHSLCLELNPFVTPDDIICTSYASTHDVYKTFWEPRGLSFNPSSKSPLKIVYRDEDTEMSRAEKIVTIDQLLRLCGDGYEDGGISISVRAVQDIPIDVPDLHPSRIVDLVEDWRKWKDEHGIYEHHDYIFDTANSSSTPNCDVLMVDEMQDYAPLEYAVIRDWIESGDIDHVVLAGDENQSIYGFKMASPYHFVNRDVDDEDVLTESYRCPEKVCSLAREVLPESDIKSATGRDGDVFAVSTPTSADLADLVTNLRRESGDVFVLTRTNRQAGYVSRTLQREGVPFCKIDEQEIDEDENRTPWRDGLVEIAKSLRSVKHRTGLVPLSSADTLFEYTANPSDRKSMADVSFDGVEIQGDGGGAVDIWSAFPSAESVSDILRKLHLSDIDRDMIEGAVESDEPLDPSSVAVGTIHSAKGRETDSVVILDAYPDKLSERYRTDEAFRKEESRLAYVAITRASESVAIARDFTDSSSFEPVAPTNISIPTPNTGSET